MAKVGSILPYSLSLLTFHISGCGIKEKKANFQVKKIGCGEKHFPLDCLLMLQEKIQEAMERNNALLTAGEQTEEGYNDY